MKLKTVIVLLSAVPCLATACTPNPKSEQAATPEHAKGYSSAPAEKVEASTIQPILDKAKKGNSPVFVIVTDKGKQNLDNAQKITSDAVSKYKGTAYVATLNRDDSQNSDIVRKWGLMSAPVPVILSISPKGNVTGGFALNDATAERLIEALPSPKFDEVYSAITAGMPSFVIVGNIGSADQKKLKSESEAAARLIPTGAKVIEISPDDSKEQKFIKQLIGSMTFTDAHLYVINTVGQLTGTFTSEAKKEQIQGAAMTVIRNSGGCCGGGGC